MRAQLSGARADIAAREVDGEGTFEVGQDIQAGTYRAAASPGCYWARLHSLDASDIIDNQDADGSEVIELLPSDAALEVHGCATLQRVR